MSQVYCIYKHTSPSGKSYIGQTCNYGARCNTHKSSSRNDSKYAFHLAIKKYGWDNFKHEILIDELTIDEANDWEKFYIFIEKTMYPNGYNLMTGGYQSIPSEETKEKIRLSATGRKHVKKWNLSIEAKKSIGIANKGKIVTHETREKIRAANIGKKYTNETKEKMRLSSTGKTLSDEARKKISNYHKDIPKTEEHKRKISEAKKGSKVSDLTKIAISNSLKGRVVSDETKNKMSLAQKNRRKNLLGNNK